VDSIVEIERWFLMAVANMRWGWMRVRHFDGTHSLSTTVQVRNRTVVADIGLFSTWAAGHDHTASLAHISQIISDSGVENFATEWGSVNSPPTLFRVNVPQPRSLTSRACERAERESCAPARGRGGEALAARAPPAFA
jgi:hypothetical protein